MNTISRWAILLFLGTTLAPLTASTTTYDVKTYGAKGDGTTLDTASIQSAIDAASAAGGGTVHLGPGTYRTVTLNLKSEVTLDLDQDALLEASPVAADWDHHLNRPVIAAARATDIGLKGKGTLDGGATVYYNAKAKVVLGSHPYMIICFSDCQHITVTGLTFRNSVKWTQVYEQCENVIVDGSTIRNREYAACEETDGIDINDCRHVLVENCDIQTGDDALCVKLEGDGKRNPPRPTYDLVFKNCTLATTCNATKIGTGTVGEGHDIHFDGITINKLSPVKEHDNPAPGGSCITAISVQSNDGGAIHDLTFKNYTVNDCDTPIFMEVQNRKSNRPAHGFGSIYNVTISDFTCLRSAKSSQINVQPGGHLKNITLNNLTIHNFGTSPGVPEPPYLNGGYPDAMKYGEMPTYGLFARCVDGLSMTGKIAFTDDGHSGRPEIKFENSTATPPPAAAK